MIGTHMQNAVQNWPLAAALLPAGTPFKAVDGVQMLSEAKGRNPGLRTVLRHWYDQGQIFGGTFEENKQRARAFFNTFIDGTFVQHAANVDFVEGFNEFLAQSQTPQEVAERVMWVRAAAHVWKHEYRTRPGLGHIRLVIANSAVGNDIPLAMAQIAVEYDCVCGYHAYVPVRTRPQTASRQILEQLAEESRAKFRDGDKPYFVPVSGTKNLAPSLANAGILAGEWPHFSGRFAEMDKRFVTAGYRVKWLITEFGAVLYYGSTAQGVHLGPNDGWRHPDVYNGNVEAYLQMMRYWMDKASAWNAVNGGRLLGATTFTSGGGDWWKLFEVRQPEMSQIAQFVKDYKPVVMPPPAPEPNDMPRVQYKRVYWVVPAGIPEAAKAEIYRLAAASNITCGPSYDDAGIGALNDKTAVLWGIPQAKRQEYVDWYNQHYAGTRVEFKELPAPAPFSG